MFLCKLQLPMPNVLTVLLEYNNVFILVADMDLGGAPYPSH